jgi:hypothetical protein
VALCIVVDGCKRLKKTNKEGEEVGGCSPTIGSVSQLGCRHLSPTTPPASTLGETSSASQVLPKGMVVRVLLVRC